MRLHESMHVVSHCAAPHSKPNDLLAGSNKATEEHSVHKILAAWQTVLKTSCGLCKEGGWAQFCFHYSQDKEVKQN